MIKQSKYQKLRIIGVIIFVFGLNTGYSQNLELGQLAPDIILNSPSGEPIKLSSLKGQMVLIDFWASWCAPCRKENPIIVKAYQEYKDSNFKNGNRFTVFSVSLDTKAESWKLAIEKDQLVWTSHVSDLKGWKSAAALSYGINSIPRSYLIDGDGIIVAINPRGDDLEINLKKLKKKSYFTLSK